MTVNAISRAIKAPVRESQLAWLAGPVFATVFAFAFFWAQAALASSDIRRFSGIYEGSAEVEQLDGEIQKRDLSVMIRETKDGFQVRWKTAIERPDGRRKTKSYDISFNPSQRPGVFSAAMTTNVFGHTVQMNPMKGEPFVWARIIDDTLTIFSMYLAENGDYVMQQYDRTLTDGGLLLEFSLHRNGQPSHTVTTFLERTGY